MAGQRCPNCQEKNPTSSEYCRECGAVLRSRAVVIAQSKPVILSKPQLPAQQIKRVGASVAIGALAVIAEIGVLYLRSRFQDGDSPRLLVQRKRSLPVTSEVRVEEKTAKGQRVVTVFSERVVEERRWGRPVRRIVDRLAWRSEETIES